MAFVYHRYPENMTGNIIYPMSELMEKYPNLFLDRQKRHEFQPHVLEGSIPKLGCFWNDTLHFTALHPRQIAEELKKSGYSMKLKYFEIQAEKLAHEKTIVYLNKPRTPGTPAKVTDFVEFNYNEVQSLAYFPPISLDRYKKAPTPDEFLLNFGAPYILYKGNFNIDGMGVVEI